MIDRLRVQRTAAVLAWTLAAAALAGCNTPTTPSSTAPFSQTDLRAGSGEEATAGQTLTVNYSGWLYDRNHPEQKGLIFDSTLGKEPFAFVLGAGQVILGWDVGLVGLRVGGVRKLIIPPSMAYGSVRNFAIPPYATLVFEVELLSIEDPSVQ